MDGLPLELCEDIGRRCGLHREALRTTSRAWRDSVGPPDALIQLACRLRAAANEGWLQGDAVFQATARDVVVSGHDTEELCDLCELVADGPEQWKKALDSALRAIMDDRFMELACGYDLRGSCSLDDDGTIRLMQRCLECGANAAKEHVWDHYGLVLHKTPFVAAAESLNTRIVEFLAQTPGIDVHFTSRTGNNAYACVHEDMLTWRDSYLNSYHADCVTEGVVSADTSLQRFRDERLEKYQTMLDLLAALGLHQRDFQYRIDLTTTDAPW
tara:strand:- start:526 stop:1338 length:813 start_codon:yes stop_codon:yes gene_type:complete